MYCAGKEPPDSCGYDIPHTAAQMCVGTQQCFYINYSEVGWSVCPNVPEFYAAHHILSCIMVQGAVEQKVWYSPSVLSALAIRRICYLHSVTMLSEEGVPAAESAEHNIN